MQPSDFLPVGHEVPEYVAGLVMVAMAVALLVHRFSDRLNRALALFLVVGGVEHIWAALDNTPAIAGLAAALLGYFRVGTLFALVYLAARYAEREGKFVVPRWAAGALLALAVVAELAYLLDHDLYLGGPGLEGGLLGMAWPARVLISAVVGLLFVRESLERDSATTGGDLLAATALSVEPAAWVLQPISFVVEALGQTGAGALGAVVEVAGNAPDALAVLMFTLASITALVNAAWLWVAGPARGHQRAATVILVAGVTGALVVPLELVWIGWGDIVLGIWQLALPLLLGYAILRHQLFDIDTKVRWGISRSTSAAVFVSVFFIVSEGAQELFSGVASSQWIGIIAAGALVFAISPLQRIGDQLAERAVPHARTGHDGPEAHYRTALRATLADGTISRDEERYLAQLAEELGLGPTRALELREEVEAETDAGVEAETDAEAPGPR